ncbi:MAG: RsmE family RNA methyltransferase [Actinomycetota bacterium]
MTREHPPHFFTDPSLIEESELTIEGPDARHLTVVRRARPGDRMSVGDGAGSLFDVRITSVTIGRVTGEVLARRWVEPPRPRLTVLQGLARGAKVDLVVQKLVEIGAAEIVVFLAGRSVPRWDPAKAESARHRWETIARDAAKQARRSRLAVVAGPVGLADACATVRGAGTALVAHDRAHRRLRDALPADLPPGIAVVVGPEGGLEPEEAAAFEDAGAEPVSLGEAILRTETAALVMASIVLYHFRLLG